MNPKNHRMATKKRKKNKRTTTKKVTRWHRATERNIIIITWGKAASDKDKRKDDAESCIL